MGDLFNARGYHRVVEHKVVWQPIETLGEGYHDQCRIAVISKGPVLITIYQYSAEDQEWRYADDLEFEGCPFDGVLWCFEKDLIPPIT